MNASDERIKAENIVRTWCMELSESIKKQNLDKHMQLVSKRVQVYGMPTEDTINYRQWELRRKNEFENDELLALNFKDTQLISSTLKRLRFHTLQTMLGKSGKMVLLDKNITLELEDDHVWRVIEEKINAWQVKQLDMTSFVQAGG